MIRELEFLDIPSTVIFLKKAFAEVFPDMEFNGGWVSDGLLMAIHSPNSTVLVCEKKGIESFIVGSMSYFLFNGEVSACSSFCYGKQKEQMRSAFEKWAKERGVTRISHMAFDGYTPRDYQKFATIFVRKS